MIIGLVLDTYHFKAEVTYVNLWVLGTLKSTCVACNKSYEI